MNALLEVPPATYLNKPSITTSRAVCKNIYSSLSCEDLMNHVINNCEIAFTALMTRHTKRVKSIARKIVYSGADIEDATQEVFINIWNNRQSWRQWRSSFSTWLYKITLHKCIDLNKKHNFCEFDALNETADDSPNAISLIHIKEFNHALSQAINSLSKKQRLAVFLHYSEGLHAHECGKILEINTQAVEGLLKRARSKLKDFLTRSHMTEFKIDGTRRIDINISIH